MNFSTHNDNVKTDNPMDFTLSVGNGTKGQITTGTSVALPNTTVPGTDTSAGNKGAKDNKTDFPSESSVKTGTPPMQGDSTDTSTPAIPLVDHSKGTRTEMIPDGAVNSNPFMPVSNTGRMTTRQATEAAKVLGYEPTNYVTKSGERVFYNKKTKTYISQDVGSGNGMGSHNGGVWKAAKSPEALNSKETRLGTYDGNLNRIGD
jgi:hypothetical protein